MEIRENESSLKSTESGLLPIYDALSRNISTLFQNTTTGIGTIRDSFRNQILNLSRGGLQDIEIFTLYKNSGLIQKIIEVIPELAKEFELTIETKYGETVDTFPIFKELNRLNFKNVFYQASVSARLFRESYVFLNVSEKPRETEGAYNSTDRDIDFLDVSEPLDITNVSRIESLELFEYGDLIPKFSRNKRQILHYELRISDESGSQVHKVHPSRILLFTGKNTTPKIREMNRGVGLSKQESIFEAFQMYHSSLSYTGNFLSRLITFIYSVKGLRQFLVKKENKDLLVNRLNTERIGGTLGGVVIDGDTEKVEHLTLSLAGVPDVISKFERFLSTNVDLPHHLLWNEGSAITASDLQHTDTQRRVKSFLRESWEENLNTLGQYIALSLEIEEEIIIRMTLPDVIISLNEKLEAEERKANINEKYLSMGVLSKEDISEELINTDFSVKAIKDSRRNFIKKQSLKDESIFEIERENHSLRLEDSQFLTTEESLSEAIKRIKEENTFIYSLMVSELEEE